jgi:dihydrolipoamide dehydrogenase
MDEFDLVVVGGGTGGYTAAIRAAQLGLTVALVERDKVGGACLHRGCIPTKAWLNAAETLERVRSAGTFGVSVPEGVALDYAAMRRRQQEVVDTLHASIRSVIQKHKIEIIEGEAKLATPREVAVGERRLAAKSVVLATGSAPKDVHGLEADGVSILTSDHLLQLDEQPKSLIIVGAGAIGCEFASYFVDTGTKVTLIETMETCVPLEDRDAGKLLAKSLVARGANVMTSASILPERTRSYDGVVELTVSYEGVEKQVRGEKVLMAVGRQAVTRGMGLENTTVKVENGWVQVNERYETAEPGVYAAGDVIGGLLLAHVAAAEGFIAAEAIASAGGGQGEDAEVLDYNRVPRVTYSRPQVASVGMTLEQAREAGRAAKAHRFSLKYNAMALIQDETEGFAKVVYDEESGDLLGVHMVGAHVSEIASEAAMARFLGASAWELGSNIHPHPTLSEVLGEAAQLSAGISIYW